MQALVAVIHECLNLVKTSEKIECIASYLVQESKENIAYGLHVLMGKNFGRFCSGKLLRTWCAEISGYPLWLLEETYDYVGDSSETIASVLAQLKPKNELVLDKKCCCNTYFSQDSERPTAGLINQLSNHSNNHLNNHVVLPLATQNASANLQDHSGVDYSDTKKVLAQHVSQELHNICYTIQALKKAPEETKKAWVLAMWQQLNLQEIYVFNKLLGGGLRIGATQKNVLKALSSTVNLPTEVLEHRLMGDWQATQQHYQALINPNTNFKDSVQPYPFYLASAIEADFELKHPHLADWIIEDKWDGIRAQLVKRGNKIVLWSRGNDLISDSFPEVLQVASALPEGVYDGELLVMKEGQVKPFNKLQKRLQRKKLTNKILEENPVTLMLYDLLELNFVDLRRQPLQLRKQKLKSAAQGIFPLSEHKGFEHFQDVKKYVEAARIYNVEGVMIKHIDSVYQVGRVKGAWWKFKTDPFTMDLVVMYVQKGRGIRSGLYTDYTFGAWHEGVLVPVAKAYSGLTQAEIKEVNQLLKKTLKEKFGPVRAVSPSIVMEIAFEGIQLSSRHKSGIALRFPRIQRLRLDKPIEEANSLADLKSLL